MQMKVPMSGEIVTEGITAGVTFMLTGLLETTGGFAQAALLVNTHVITSLLLSNTGEYVLLPVPWFIPFLFH
jgi:hypothetical protein